MPQPLYQPATAKGAYQLRYSWSAWPSRGEFPAGLDDCLRDCATPWELEGLRVLEFQIHPEQCQVTFSVTPACSPNYL
ncbi:MAG: hypothetical protein ACK5EA_03485 [Planctomycetaceae bacterium]